MVAAWQAPAAGSDAVDDLVESALAGDRDALDQLIATVHPLVVKYCRARVAAGLRAVAGADDVAQEVCLAVVSALPGYRRGSTPFLGFVYGIAAHKVADVHRASAKVLSIPVPEIPDAADSADSPEQQAMRSATAARIGQMVATLPPQQQEILRLRVVVGLSAEQTAAALEMSAGAVRVAQHRALGRLRSLLTEAGEAPVDQGGWAEVIG
ncbi:RNA polymerase sigma factor ShbA [Nakamurella lactea]|uniref:RNA polymerase sigma factor ShbA n=1 Tax=Nakamurella lactea TaxID=459515 RepID=UPI0004099604|nr:RNA polymerase sigma factor ShbA [Nakamurella lactea]